MIRWIILALFVGATLVVHYRGRVRLPLWRQIPGSSTLLAPINVLMYGFSSVPNQPYLSRDHFPELGLLEQHWQEIRDEAVALLRGGHIRKSPKYDDLGFNSFFKTGWKRFYLKWYNDAHPSAAELCPRTTELLRSIGTVKAAMFTELPPGARLVRHRDPYAGSLRYHLGLVTPNSADCYIDVDGQRYFWRDGESVVFDETFLHYAENTTQQDRIILFCDVERPLRYRWMQSFNLWFGRNVVAAAASPNDAGDRTGALNYVFGLIYPVRPRIKRFKADNRRLYYVLKWVLILGLLGLVMLW
jgi:beta-hydroxylase